ncbi:MAG: Xaa-Pro peptidase family protein [Bacteroidota bacterium]|nr:Xaa-Pro peptidase family protein [Bacteroidota bacterium]
MEKERQLRIEKIRTQMAVKKVDACLLSTSVNLLYAAGRVVNGYLYIPAEEDPLLFVRRPAGLAEDDLLYIHKPEEIPGLLRETGLSLPSTLMVEGGEISYADWMRLQACFPKATLYDGTSDLRYVRSVKTDYECDQLRASAEAHARAYKKIPALFRPGMTDIQFSIEIERLMRLEGNKGLFRTFGDMEAFMGSVLTGENAAVPSPYDFALGGAGDPSNPIGANGSVLKEGNSVMIDMCGNFTGYLDDITRTFSIGTLPEKAYKAHQTAIEIQDRIQENLKEGTLCEDIYKLALTIAASNGLADCFMGTLQQAKFVGHGVGLVINEPPVLAKRSKEVLLPNMAIAVEPKFVIDGIGAVGLEDTYLVGKTGGEKITLVEPGIIDLLKGY